MEHARSGRRRIDRVTAPDLLDDLEGLSAEVIRALRDECREEETRLSYARRLVQGKLDIARTELGRRGGDVGGGTDALVEQLAHILADEPTLRPREARTVTFYEPEEEGPERRGEDVGPEGVPLSSLPDLDQARVDEVIAALEAEEEQLSLARRAVLHNLDGLQSELVRRYREGSADLDALMSTALASRRGDEDAD
jgi:hypothetical protein